MILVIIKQNKKKNADQTGFCSFSFYHFEMLDKF